MSRKLSPEKLSFQYPELVLPKGLGWGDPKFGSAFGSKSRVCRGFWAQNSEPNSPNSRLWKSRPGATSLLSNTDFDCPGTPAASVLLPRGPPAWRQPQGPSAVPLAFIKFSASAPPPQLRFAARIIRRVRSELPSLCRSRQKKHCTPSFQKLPTPHPPFSAATARPSGRLPGTFQGQGLESVQKLPEGCPKKFLRPPQHN